MTFINTFHFVIVSEAALLQISCKQAQLNPEKMSNAAIGGIFNNVDFVYQ